MALNVYIVLSYCAFLFLIDFQCAQCNLKVFVTYDCIFVIWVAESFTQPTGSKKCSGTKQATLVQKWLKPISTIYDHFDLKSQNYEIKKKGNCEIKR